MPPMVLSKREKKLEEPVVDETNFINNLDLSISWVKQRGTTDFVVRRKIFVVRCCKKIV
jgi:hypothetical protein